MQLKRSKLRLRLLGDEVDVGADAESFGIEEEMARRLEEEEGFCSFGIVMYKKQEVHGFHFLEVLMHKKQAGKQASKQASTVEIIAGAWVEVEI